MADTETSASEKIGGLGSDVVSGFATGPFSIPEGMGNEQIAGVNLVYGLYSGVVATLNAVLITGTILWHAGCAGQRHQF